MKSIWIGIGFIGCGLVANMLLDQLLGIYSIASWVGTMCAMVAIASMTAYQVGKNESKRANPSAPK